MLDGLGVFPAATPGRPTTAVSTEGAVDSTQPFALIDCTLARCALDKFGGDSMNETLRNHRGYLEQLKNY